MIILIYIWVFCGILYANKYVKEQTNKSIPSSGLEWMVIVVWLWILLLIDDIEMVGNE